MVPEAHELAYAGHVGNARGYSRLDVRPNQRPSQIR